MPVSRRTPGLGEAGRVSTFLALLLAASYRAHVEAIFRSEAVRGRSLGPWAFVPRKERKEIGIVNCAILRFNGPRLPTKRTCFLLVGRY